MGCTHFRKLVQTLLQRVLNLEALALSDFYVRLDTQKINMVKKNSPTMINGAEKFYTVL